MTTIATTDTKGTSRTEQILAEVAGRENDRRREANDAYRDLAKQIAEGRPLMATATDIDDILQETGFTVADLKGDAARLESARRKLELVFDRARLDAEATKAMHERTRVGEENRRVMQAWQDKYAEAQKKENAARREADRAEEKRHDVWRMLPQAARPRFEALVEQQKAARREGRAEVAKKIEREMIEFVDAALLEKPTPEAESDPA